MENYTGKNTNDTNCNTKVSHDCSTECDAAVLSADTLTGAENYPWWKGDFKIPRVLAEFVVQIDSESKIRLNEPAYEIKRIEKQIFLTQCRYIPPTNKVFLEGYIRKNIEYAAKSCARGYGIAGTIRDTTVHVPFKAYTKVDFHGNKPQIIPNPPAMVARYFDEKRMGKDIREADRSNIEIFNEPVFCELEWSAVYDADIDNKGKHIDGFLNEEEFQEFTDKSVVYLCIKLLQKQQVCWPDYYKPHTTEEAKNMPYPLNTEWAMPLNEAPEKK
ncbi:MAG: hypothetical protein K0S76_2621 [Herbinix sp.]|jgi:hypothetical protein|nr:hypothetical protein [Herbinix sp.]